MMLAAVESSSSSFMRQAYSPPQSSSQEQINNKQTASNPKTTTIEYSLSIDSSASAQNDEDKTIDLTKNENTNSKLAQSRSSPIRRGRVLSKSLKESSSGHVILNTNSFSIKPREFKFDLRGGETSDKLKNSSSMNGARNNGTSSNSSIYNNNAASKLSYMKQLQQNELKKLHSFQYLKHFSTHLQQQQLQNQQLLDSENQSAKLNQISKKQV
jgi:hypothetical protein